MATILLLLAMGWVSLNPACVVFVGSQRLLNKGSDWLLSARRVRITHQAMSGGDLMKIVLFKWLSIWINGPGDTKAASGNGCHRLYVRDRSADTMNASQKTTYLSRSSCYSDIFTYWAPQNNMATVGKNAIYLKCLEYFSILLVEGDIQ